MATARHTVAAALVAACALLLSLIAGLPAAAEAGEPHAYTIAGDAYVHHKDFLWSEGGRDKAGADARTYVHEQFAFDGCGTHGDLCTIQAFNGDRYRVYHFHGCGRFGLDNFSGLFDTHNWTGRDAVWLNQNGAIIGTYWALRHDPVEWGPIWRILTCQ